MKNILKKICMVCYQISMPAFMLIGTVMVLTQLYCCLAIDGKLCAAAAKTLQPWASKAAGLCLFASFFYSYLEPVKKK